MTNLDIIETAAHSAGIGTTHLGLRLGKAASTYGVMRNRGTSPAVDVYADMLAACGWGLAAMPLGDIPAGAQIIQGRKSTDGVLPDDLPPNSR